jgi:hypothetical protein
MDFVQRSLSLCHSFEFGTRETSLIRDFYHEATVGAVDVVRSGEFHFFDTSMEAGYGLLGVGKTLLGTPYSGLWSADEALPVHAV